MTETSLVTIFHTTKRNSYGFLGKKPTEVITNLMYGLTTNLKQAVIELQLDLSEGVADPPTGRCMVQVQRGDGFQLVAHAVDRRILPGGRDDEPSGPGRRMRGWARGFPAEERALGIADGEGAFPEEQRRARWPESQSQRRVHGSSTQNRERQMEVALQDPYKNYCCPAHEQSKASFVWWHVVSPVGHVR